MTVIQRVVDVLLSVNFSQSAIASSTPINFSNYASGTVHVAAVVSGGTALTWQSSPDSGVTWYPLYDGNGSPLTTTITSNAAQAYPIPTQCFGCKHIAAMASGSYDIPAILTLKT